MKPILVEHIINLMLIEAGQGSVEDFQETLSIGLRNNNHNFDISYLTTEKLEEAKELYVQLLYQWVMLPDEDSMVLHFK